MSRGRKRSAKINNRKDDSPGQESWWLWKKAKEKQRKTEKAYCIKHLIEDRETRADWDTWFLEAISGENGGVL